LGHVSINASGSGIANSVLASWDYCSDCSNSTPIVGPFSIDVPSGTGRLIQVLAVYKDSTTNQMIFYYGDATADLNGGDLNLDVNVSQVGQGNITSGHVSGRYFTTATGGPTGVVDIKYNPGSSKPSMVVERGWIANGWFNVFMLSGATLQYVVRETGDVLWGQEMSFESAEMMPSANSGAYFDQRVRANLPVSVRMQNNGGTTTYYPQEANTFVWGYWGPGATGKKVCTSGLDSSPSTINLKMYNTSSPASSPALTVSHYINYGLTLPTKAQLTDTADPYNYIVVEGGTSMSSSCAGFPDDATNRYLNFQKITLNLFDGGGGEEVAGFRGIFQQTASKTFVTMTGDPKTLVGQVLPGITEVFDSIRLYKRTNVTDDPHVDSPNCLDIAKSGSGYVLGSSDAALDAAGNFSLTSNITSTEATAGVVGVLCPVHAGTLVPSGVFLGKWNFNSSAMMQNQISVMKNGPPMNLAPTYQCIGLTVQIWDSNRVMSNSVNFSLTPSTAVNFFASMADCNAGTPTLSPGSLIMPANQNMMQIYMKTPISPVTGFSITPASGSLPAMNLTMDTVSSGYYVGLDLPFSMVAGSCYQGTATYNSISSGQTPPGTSVTGVISAPANLAFYTDGTCSSVAANPAYFTTGVSLVNVYAKVTGTPNGPLLLTTSGSGLLNANFNVSIGQGTANPAMLMIGGPPQATYNTCIPVDIALGNSNNTPVPALSSVNITLSAGSGTFYSDSSCTSSTSSGNIPVGAHKTSMWVKYPSPSGAQVLSATASGLTSGSWNINIQ
jgi:hypothetical protein